MSCRVPFVFLVWREAFPLFLSAVWDGGFPREGFRQRRGVMWASAWGFGVDSEMWFVFAVGILLRRSRRSCICYNSCGGIECVSGPRRFSIPTTPGVSGTFILSTLGFPSAVGLLDWAG